MSLNIFNTVTECRDHLKGVAPVEMTQEEADKLYYTVGNNPQIYARRNVTARTIGQQHAQCARKCGNNKEYYLKITPTQGIKIGVFTTSSFSI